MKKLFILFLGLLLSTPILFMACKKASSNDATENLLEAQAQSDDQAAVSTQTDEINTDASTMVENVIAISGNSPQTFFPSPCNSVVTYDTLNANRTITITYNGLNCSGTLSRTGVVTISIPAGVQWKNAGAKLTVTTTNLKITRVATQKSITINGSHIITNVSGGLLRNLASVGTITHTIESPGVIITFDNGSQRTWQVAKQRVFTYNNGIVVTTTGIHSDGNTTGISEWGTNRFGNAFVTQIVAPMVIRQDCNWRLTSGQVKHSRMLRTADVTFGLDAAGNPTSCPTGTYYMKIIWVNAAGTSVTVILPY